MTTKQIVWGQPYKQFDLTAALSQYVQQPPCEYDYSFAAKIGVWNDALGVFELYALPSWFQ